MGERLSFATHHYEGRASIGSDDETDAFHIGAFELPTPWLVM
jgi:hypothetical protein